MSNLLTASRLRTFRACPYKHHLMYDEGWRPVSVAEPLLVGTLAHAALEAYWLSLKHDPLARPEDRAAIAVEAMDRAAEKVPEDDERLPRLEAMRQLVWRYALVYGADDLARYEVLAVEVPFTLPLMNPATGGTSRTWLTAGKIDAVVREKHGAKRVLVVEHKTTSESIDDGDAGSYFRRLAMDAQVSAYYLGAEKAGIVPTGCLYDVLRKPAQRISAIPVLDENGQKVVLDAAGQRVRTKDGKKWRETGDSAAGYVVQTRPETVEEYGKRVADVLAAEPLAFLQRRDVARTDGDLADYLSETWTYGRIIAEQAKDARHPKNPDECHRFNVCPFWEHCAYKVNMADHPERWQKVDDVHPELPQGVAS